MVLLVADRINIMVSEDWRDVVLGLAASGAGLFAGVLQPLSGAYSDSYGSRWGRRVPIVALGTVATILCLVPLALGGHFLLFWVFVPSYIASNCLRSTAASKT